MKVQCEYCQNMVEVRPGTDRICPYCGSPLPAAPEPPRQAAAPQKPGRPALLILPLLAVVLFFGLAAALPALRRNGGPSQVRQDISASEALAAVKDGTADGSVYQVVIAYYLEAGSVDSAWSAAWELVQREDGDGYPQV